MTKYELDLKDDFNLKQQILRTKLRVQNNREEPVDYIAKVILMIYGQIAANRQFCLGLNDSTEALEYRAPYLILEALDKPSLEQTR